jgi:hypothetical protein
MKDLLTGGDFVIEELRPWKDAPPYSNDSTFVDEPYDFKHIVRSSEYPRRYFRCGVARSHLVWAFKAGTRIANRLSEEEKQTVAQFAEEALKKPEKIPDKDDTVLKEKERNLPLSQSKSHSKLPLKKPE